MLLEAVALIDPVPVRERPTVTVLEEHTLPLRERVVVTVLDPEAHALERREGESRGLAVCAPLDDTDAVAAVDAVGDCDGEPLAEPESDPSPDADGEVLAETLALRERVLVGVPELETHALRSSEGVVTGLQLELPLPDKLGVPAGEGEGDSEGDTLAEPELDPAVEAEGDLEAEPLLLRDTVPVLVPMADSEPDVEPETEALMDADRLGVKEVPEVLEPEPVRVTVTDEDGEPLLLRDRELVAVVVGVGQALGGCVGVAAALPLRPL